MSLKKKERETLPCLLILWLGVYLSFSYSILNLQHCALEQPLSVGQRLLHSTVILILIAVVLLTTPKCISADSHFTFQNISTLLDHHNLCAAIY